jgi:hypothetical protein
VSVCTRVVGCSKPRKKRWFKQGAVYACPHCGRLWVLRSRTLGWHEGVSVEWDWFALRGDPAKP